MQKHSSQERGNQIPVNGSLWPDCAIEVDPYRLPAHIEFDAPCPVFTNVAVNRTVSIYKGFVVVTDKLGLQSTTQRVIALDDFDAVVVRVGFNSHRHRQIGSAVYLHHKRLGLDLPLYAAVDCQDTAVFWYSWARVLGVPAMSISRDGSLIDPFNRLGQVCISHSKPRRSFISQAAQRPSVRQQSARHKRRIEKINSARQLVGPAGSQTKDGSNVYNLFG